MDAAVERAAEAVEMILQDGVDAAMNVYNRKQEAAAAKPEESGRS